MRTMSFCSIVTLLFHGDAVLAIPLDRFGAADDFGLLLRIDVVGGRAITPELSQSDRRLFEFHGDTSVKEQSHVA